MQELGDGVEYVGYLGLDSPVSDSAKTIPSIANRVNHILGVTSRGRITPMANLEEFGIAEQFVSPEQAPIIVKEIHTLEDIVNRFEIELHYVKSGSTGHTFKAKCRKTGKIIFAIKVAAYPLYLEDPKDPNSRVIRVVDDIKQAQNTELRMILLLSKLVMHGKTPHIVLPLWTFNTHTSIFVEMGMAKDRPSATPDRPYRSRGAPNLLRRSAQYLEFVEGYRRGELDEISSVLVSEWCDQGDLLDYIRNRIEKRNEISEEEWKIIFFQTLIMLAKIHEVYPNFKHNDFKCNNILMQSTPSENKGKYYCYPLGDRLELIVPDIGYQLKMWDFDFASIGQYVPNSKVDSRWAEGLGISSKQNQYYDVHYFFHFFLTDSICPGMDRILPPSIMEFIRRIIPTKYRPRLVEVIKTHQVTGKKKKFLKETNQNLNRSSRLFQNVCYTTPIEILNRDTLFKEFRRSRNE